MLKDGEKQSEIQLLTANNSAVVGAPGAQHDESSTGSLTQSYMDMEPMASEQMADMRDTIASDLGKALNSDNVAILEASLTDLSADVFNEAIKAIGT
jgi:hypothetical protein